MAALAQPSIGGVVNAASYAQAVQDSNSKPIGNNIVAQSAIFVVFGSNLGPAALVQNFVSPVPTILPATNGTSVTVTSGGQTFPALMVYTSAGQVAAILPSNTPLGPASVTVTYNGQTSAPFKITVVKTAPGVFTRNGQGTGPAIAQIYPDNALDALTHSAQPGETLTMYATGMGPAAVPDNLVSPPTALGNVTVNIAGQTVTGSAFQISPGFDQFNFQVPANAPAGCYIPAEVTVNGQPSNLFYLSIASGTRTCTHPLGLGQDALARLDAGGTANLGHFLMLRAVVQGVPAEGTGGVFDSVDANGAFQLTNRILYAFGGASYPVAVGSCAVLDSLDPGAGFTVPDLSQVGGKELLAGDGLTVSGPKGVSQGIIRNLTGGYLGVFFATLGQGTWSVIGTGGADVGAFTAKTDLPDNLVWTNAGNFSNVPRSDITVTWTGGSVNAQSVITVFGSSTVINPTDPSKSRGKQFYCNAPASAGKFTIPVAVISQMPSSTVDTAAGEVEFGSLGLNSGGGSSFTAPLNGGAKLDAGYLAFGEAHTLPVKYQ